MRKTFEKKEKGITLIALVITIIVLLILAGITISMLLGEDGILKQSTDSKLKNDIGKEIEQIKVSALATYEKDGIIPYSTFEEEMRKYTDVSNVERADTKADDYQLVSKEKKPNNLSNLLTPVSYATNGEDNPNYAKITYVTARIYYIRLTKNENGDPPGSIYTVSDPDPNPNANNTTSNTTNNTTNNTSSTPSADYLALREGDKVLYTYNGTEIPCTVLYDAEPTRSYANDGYGVQIVADDIVGNVALGNGAGVVNSWDQEHFAASVDSYNDAIGILNRATESYINTDFATDARCIGSVPNSKNSKNTAKYSNELKYFASYNNRFEAGEEAEGYTANYITDVTKMGELGISNLSVRYWLASRYSYVYGSTYFCVRFLDPANAVMDDCLSCVYDTYGWGPASNDISYGLRPVFTLRNDIGVVMGENNVKVLTK